MRQGACILPHLFSFVPASSAARKSSNSSSPPLLRREPSQTPFWQVSMLLSSLPLFPDQSARLLPNNFFNSFSFISRMFAYSTRTNLYEPCVFMAAHPPLNPSPTFPLLISPLSPSLPVPPSTPLLLFFLDCQPPFQPHGRGRVVKGILTRARVRRQHLHWRRGGKKRPRPVQPLGVRWEAVRKS